MHLLCYQNTRIIQVHFPNSISCNIEPCACLPCINRRWKLWGCNFHYYQQFRTLWYIIATS